MSLEYIRNAYKVDARRGMRVEYTGGSSPRLGTISGARGARLMILLDGDDDAHAYHPTWELRYLPDAKPGDALPACGADPLSTSCLNHPEPTP